ncbi:Heme iron utilization protein [Candidatus Sulfobium mesophilum]|uniref:Heme iron utilization protein n=1 Tax=Candidatus Sulfobium mesophilum TaxID=2016548 RepID=A0A2U3QE44_9BACT|nr:Heme iron utilization protein [Candidatus Sulfobium mesophilum]
MEAKEIRQAISDYLKNHRKMTLATVTLDGRPLAHTVEYVSDDGPVLYFATRKTTRKAQNIMKNENVSLAVDEDYDDWMKIQGVQAEGRATILSQEKDIKYARELFLKKFPFVAEFAPDPDMIFVKIEPVAGFFLDNTQGFAHRDEVKF